MTLPELSLTLAVFRCPELGFLGLVMPTFRQTPFSAGRPTVAGERGRRALRDERPWVRTWFSVARGRGVEEKRRWEGDVTVKREKIGIVVLGMRTIVGLKVRRRRACSAVEDGVGGMVGGLRS